VYNVSINNEDMKTYILKKDLPWIKAGSEWLLIDENTNQVHLVEREAHESRNLIVCVPDPRLSMTVSGILDFDSWFQKKPEDEIAE